LSSTISSCKAVMAFFAFLLLSLVSGLVACGSPHSGVLRNMWSHGHRRNSYLGNVAARHWELRLRLLVCNHAFSLPSWELLLWRCRCGCLSRWFLLSCGCHCPYALPSGQLLPASWRCGSVRVPSGHIRLVDRLDDRLLLWKLPLLRCRCNRGDLVLTDVNAINDANTLAVCVAVSNAVRFSHSSGHSVAGFDALFDADPVWIPVNDAVQYSECCAHDDDIEQSESSALS
jgi:hypothetical protein